MGGHDGRPPISQVVQEPASPYGASGPLKWLLGLLVLLAVLAQARVGHQGPWVVSARRPRPRPEPIGHRGEGVQEGV
jgi:hypothetical protein